jgi:hypothetical protein
MRRAGRLRAVVPALGCAALVACASARTVAAPTPSTASAAATRVAAASGDVAFVTRAYNAGVYGVDWQVTYVPAAAEHLMKASFAAGGMTGDAEFYQAGVDDDGPPQHPLVAAGEHLGVTGGAVPDCAAAELGAKPSLTVTLESAAGPAESVDLAVADGGGALANAAKAWCAAGLTTTLQGASGQGCPDHFDVLVRNPTSTVARLALSTAEPAGFAAQPIDVPAASSVVWHLVSTTGCHPPTHKPHATARFSDGRSVDLTLDLSSAGG